MSSAGVTKLDFDFRLFRHLKVFKKYHFLKISAKVGEAFLVTLYISKNIFSWNRHLEKVPGTMTGPDFLLSSF